MTGTDLYRRVISMSEGDKDGGQLTHQVWSGTPWMCDAYQGRESKDDNRVGEMILWCNERFGREAWPIHERLGRWHRASFTLDGWTWFGFDTEAAMKEFQAKFPNPEEPK